MHYMCVVRVDKIFISCEQSASHSQYVFTSCFALQCHHFNLLLCNLQGEIRGVCLVWLWCRESGKFM